MTRLASVESLNCVSDLSTPPPLKLLSFADDLQVFLSSPREWPVLLSHS